MNRQLTLLLLLGISLVAFSCKEEDSTGRQQMQYPIVMAHGFLASGDTYANHFKRFTSNGYPADHLFAFNWNTLGNDSNELILDQFIDSVMQLTGKEKVILGGHSAGGGLGYSYLSDSGRAAKVHRYIHIGSSPEDTTAGPDAGVPTLNIWSPDDEVVQGADIPGATNVQLAGQDHYEVATSEGSFAAIYEFVTGETPASTGIIPESSITLSGKALTLGENQPLGGATVNIYAVDAATAERQSTDPAATFTVSAHGSWGPFNAQPDRTYEFELVGSQPGDRTVYYYREGFSRSDELVYLRGLPTGSSLPAQLLSSIPEDDDQAAMIVFSANKAVIDTRDELIVDGNTLSTANLASSDQTAIAFFLYDDDGDDSTSLQKDPFFGAFPFLNAVDVFFPTTPPGTISCSFNGRQLNVRNYRSDSDGVVVAVFN